MEPSDVTARTHPFRYIADFLCFLILFGFLAWGLDLSRPVQEWRLLKAVQNGNLATAKVLMQTATFPASGLIQEGTGTYNRDVSLVDYAIVANQKEMADYLFTEFPIFRTPRLLASAWKSAAQALVPDMLKWLPERGGTLSPASYSSLITPVINRGLLCPRSPEILNELSAQSLECLEVLTGLGADLTANDHQGLRDAIDKSDVELVRFFLERTNPMPQFADPDKDPLTRAQKRAKENSRPAAALVLELLSSGTTEVGK